MKSENQTPSSARSTRVNTESSLDIDGTGTARRPVPAKQGGIRPRTPSLPVGPVPVPGNVRSLATATVDRLLGARGPRRADRAAPMDAVDPAATADAQLAPAPTHDCTTASATDTPVRRQ